MAVTWTQEDLENIEKAIATGALVVKYTDREVRYRSLNEMKEVRDMIRKALGVGKKTGRVFAEFKKGTC